MTRSAEASIGEVDSGLDSGSAVQESLAPDASGVEESRDGAEGSALAADCVDLLQGTEAGKAGAGGEEGEIAGNVEQAQEAEFDSKKNGADESGGEAAGESGGDPQKLQLEQQQQQQQQERQEPALSGGPGTDEESKSEAEPARTVSQGKEGTGDAAASDSSVKAYSLEPATDSDSDNDNVKLVLNAAELLEKLEIEDNSDHGSAADDDLSSSIESTANSGAVHSQEVSGDDETTSLPKKRIDLRHHSIRGIVKIQHDRDQYEKQCQIKKQGGSLARTTLEDQDRRSSIGGGSTTRRAFRRSSAPGTPNYTTEETSRSSVLATSRQPPKSAGYHQKRQFSFVDMAFNQGSGFDKGKQQANIPLYRPPKCREDTDKEQSPMQVTGLPVSGGKLKSVPEPPRKLPANLKITFSDGGREVKELHEERASGLPSSFEFKATAVRKQLRNNGLSKPSRGIAVPREASTPRSESEKSIDMNYKAQRPEAPTFSAVEKLPPKDKPFAAENTNVRWSDIVDSEAEPSPTAVESGSLRLEAPVPAPAGNSRQRKHRQKKKDAGQRQHQQHQQQEAEDHSDADSQNKDTPRRSVFQRLGPRVIPGSAPSRTVMYEPRMESRLESLPMPSHRDFENSAEAVARAAAAAYRDSKQKRTRLELYVPRRGG